MAGDYYTNTIVSGSPNTNMIGQPDRAVPPAGSAEELRRLPGAAALVRPAVLHGLLPHPDPAREQGGPMTAVGGPDPAPGPAPPGCRPGAIPGVVPTCSPRSPGCTSCGRSLPIVIAVQFSFNDGRSRSTWQGFSTQWYCCAEGSVGEDPSLLLALQEQPDPRRARRSWWRRRWASCSRWGSPDGVAEQQGRQRHRPGPARHAGARHRVGALPGDGQPVPVRPAGPAGHAAGPRHVLGLVRARDRALAVAEHRRGVRGGRPGPGRELRSRRSGRS